MYGFSNKLPLSSYLHVLETKIKVLDVQNIVDTFGKSSDKIIKTWIKSNETDKSKHWWNWEIIILLSGRLPERYMAVQIKNNKSNHSPFWEVINFTFKFNSRFNTLTTYWDDGNKNNEDGCSNTCSVENWFSWSWGNSTSKDNWNLKSIYLDAILTVQILSMIWVWANSLSSLLNMSSPIGVFTIINQFQLLFLIVVSGAYLSEGVLELIIGMKIVLLNFNFTFIDGIRLIENKMYSYMSFDQPNKHLYDIGVIHKQILKL